jgi:hypothetical protein
MCGEDLGVECIVYGNTIWRPVVKMATSYGNVETDYLGRFGGLGRLAGLVIFPLLAASKRHIFLRLDHGVKYGRGGGMEGLRVLDHS